MIFRGRPPFFPFALAAAALAALVAWPPFLPRLTAAAFLLTAYAQRRVAERMTVTIQRNRPADMRADRVVAGGAECRVFRNLLAEIVGRETVYFAASALGFGKHLPQSFGVPAVSGAELVGRELLKKVRHAVKYKPKRLGCQGVFS